MTASHTSSSVTANMQTYQAFSGAAAGDSRITGETAVAAMFAAASPDIEIVEPGSLPHAGTHRGHDEWRALIADMRTQWDQHGQVQHVWEIADDDLIIVYTTMDWTARSTGKRVEFPSIQLLRFENGLIAKVEIFHQDVAAVIGTLT